MTPLTVACVWVQGEYPYTVDYVTRLRAMVSRWIDRPFRFVCLTDRPQEVQDSIETIQIAKLPGCFAYWSKLELFNPLRAWTGRMLYLDLDTLVVAPLAPIVDVPAPLALIADTAKPGHKAKDKYGRHIVRRFNSSVMVWNGGGQAHLYESWSPAVAARLSGDQDHIGEQSPAATALPAAWFPRVSQIEEPPFAPEVKVILSKYPKNDIAAQRWPWFEPLWGAA